MFPSRIPLFLHRFFVSCLLATDICQFATGFPVYWQQVSPAYWQQVFLPIGNRFSCLLATGFSRLAFGYFRLAFGTQCTSFMSGCLRRMAPGTGHAVTQQPQYQHSPGKAVRGGSPLLSEGSITSTWQMSTQRLHPVHFAASQETGADTGISHAVPNAS
jgi:hypothetical protein